MKFVGNRFNKILVERFNQEGELILGGINSNAITKEIKELNSNKTSSVISFVFDYTVKYGLKDSEENFASMDLSGEAFFELDKKAASKLINDFKEKKATNTDEFISGLQVILNLSQIESVVLARQMNLPAPINLGKVSKKE